MEESIVSLESIRESARAAADAVATGLPMPGCPFPADGPAADRWRIAFYAREMELLGEAA